MEQIDYIPLQQSSNLPSDRQANEYLLPATARVYFTVLRWWVNFLTNCLFYNYGENFVRTALYDKISFHLVPMYHLTYEVCLCSFLLRPCMATENENSTRAQMILNTKVNKSRHLDYAKWLLKWEIKTFNWWKEFMSP